MSRISHLILALILGLFGLFLLFQTVVSSVRAVDLTVLNANDSGAGSLRETIAIASDGDTIFFDSSLNGHTITLTSGQLLITKNLTISGPSANLLTVSGNNVSRVFSITSTVTVSGLTIKNGFVFRGSIGDRGGGISNEGGIVNLINCTIRNNVAVGSILMPGVGGGIYNNGTLNLTNSTISSNTAGIGGGIANRGTLNLTNSNVSSNIGTDSVGGIYTVDGDVNLTNSTVSSNVGTGGGGGIEIFSGVVNLTKSTVFSNTVFHNDGGGIVNANGEANLTNSTVSGNTAARAGGGIFNLGIVNLMYSTISGNSAGSDGGGIYSGPDATMALTNTILAYNQDISNANDCTNFGGTVTSGGYNLVQTPNNCVFSSTGDITNTNPLLGQLQDNGGDTLTHALLNGSPAIDEIPNGTSDCGTVFTTDQRGVTRPSGKACDIGSYEVRHTLEIRKDGPEIAIAGNLITYTLELSNNLPITLTNLVITDAIPTGASYIGGGTMVGNVVSWTVPTLVAGETISRQFDVTATLTITNSEYRVEASGGYSATGSLVVITLVEVPVTGLEATNDSPTVVGTATFLSATISAGTNVAYAWDFGDGDTGRGANLAHTYLAVGVYTAVVTSSNSVNSLIASTVVTVQHGVSIVYLPLVVRSGVSGTQSSVPSSAESSFLIDNGIFRFVDVARPLSLIHIRRP